MQKANDDRVWYPGKEQEDFKKSIESKLEQISQPSIEDGDDGYIKLGNTWIKKTRVSTSNDKNEEGSYLNPSVNVGKPPEHGQMSFINKEEEEEAKKFIEEEFLCGHRPRISGFYMALMVYERSEKILNEFGQETSLIYADETIKADKWRNCVGRVVLQGPDCYVGERFPFKENWFRTMIRPFFNRWMKPARQQPWCKVGDWVMFPRAEGTPVMFKGKPLVLIPDDRALIIVQNPTDITRD